MIEPGTLLQNRYRVTRQIGQGGMGAVYVATDERFHSIVAIKQTFFFDDPALGKAFEREARLLNHLRHSALPKVSDHFTEGSEQFLVMEFIEGTDFWALMKERRGAFPVADVLRWADELLDVLNYLHRHEPPIIHRDIKPPNIKLTASGRIVLLDFGLAKGTPAQTPASVTGSVIGYSPMYAPLEQIQGTGTDPCSDLYSLAATLYHLITGVAPIDALARAGAIINHQPDPLRPPHVANTEVPAAVSKVIWRAMALKSSLRPKSAAEMRDMLRQAMSMSPYDARQSPAPSAFMRSQTEIGEATILEPHAQAASLASQFASFSGVTVEANSYGGRLHQVENQTTQTVRTQERPASNMLAKVLIAAAVLAICAVAAVTLITRTDAPHTKLDLQSDASTGASAKSLPDTPEGTTSLSVNGNPASPAQGASTSSQTQPTDVQVVANAPAVSSQPASGVASPAAGVLNTGESVAGSGGANNQKPAAIAETENKSPVVTVVQPPVATPTPPTDLRAAEIEARRIEDARHAEDVRREENARRVEESQRADELRRSLPPPPPDERRPPPPGGQFPPRRPPPF